MRSLDGLLAKGKRALAYTTIALTIFMPMKASAQDTDSYLNVFAQPNPSALVDAYGSGDSNEDGFLRRDDLEYMKESKPKNNQSDINGDGVKSDSLDIKLLEDLFSGKIDYLPGHFNSFPIDSLRVKRNDWGVKMVTINQTDTIPNISPEFDCGEHAVMNLLRLRGYNGSDIPGIYYIKGYDDPQNGESNLPVYIAGFYPLDKSQGHATNAMYIGPDSSDTEIDVTDHYQWLFFESLYPKDRFYDNARDLPINSKIWVHGVERFTDSGAPFKFTILGWETDSKGNISLIYQHPDLVEVPTDMPTIKVDTTNVAIAEDLAVPSAYSLSQNYPNPFNPTTTISYSIPKGGHVSLSVYDIRGKELETLVNETQSPGEYKINFNASKHPSGIYFYRLEARDDTKTYTKTEKMLLVK